MPEEMIEKRWNPEVIAGLREVLFAIEPELRRLHATVTNLTILATAPDNIEPVALTVLTEVGGEAIERLTRGWRNALDLVQAN